MLLASHRQFNLGYAAAIVLWLLASATTADEIRRWRDSAGNLHVTIEGAPAKPGADSGMTAEQRFSVETSLRRRNLEKRLKTASAALGRARDEMKKIKGKRLVVYSPPAPPVSEDAQSVLDAQRNAFLTARAFEQDRDERLRNLRREERDRLREIEEIWKQFDALRAEVKQAYGGLPSWWRDRLDCPGCPTRSEVETALKERKKPKPAKEPGPRAEE